MKSIGILHTPVFQAGTLQVLRDWEVSKLDTVFVPTKDITTHHQRCADIRSLTGFQARDLIRATSSLCVEAFDSLDQLPKDPDISVIHCGSDEVSTGVAQAYRSLFPIGLQPELKASPVFLRWDRKNVFTQKPVSPDITMSRDEFCLDIMGVAIGESSQSSDWWRQVGGVVVKDKTILLTGHNQHLPNEWAPYIAGDPRDACEPGQNSELCSAIHAEQAIISEAARKGIPLEGTSLFISTFPCPVCAKLVANAGIKKVYFHEGHASLDVPEIFTSFGVQVIHVPT